MESSASYQPRGLEELSVLKKKDFSEEEIEDLREVVLAESRQALRGLQQEIDQMHEQIFSLDAFYSIQHLVNEFEYLLILNHLEDHEIFQDIFVLREHLDARNPISSLAHANQGHVLLHTADITSLKNLLSLTQTVAEVCTTASSLRIKDDIFQSATKKSEAGFIYDPKDAIAWFTKDVGSSRKQGKRVIDPKNERYRAHSLEEALARKQGKRVEAWVDVAKRKPHALLILDDTVRDHAVALAATVGLPVLYHSHLFESREPAHEPLLHPADLVRMLQDIKYLKAEALETEDEDVFEELRELSDRAKTHIERVRALNRSAVQALMEKAYRIAGFDPIDAYEMGFTRSETQDFFEKI